MTIYRETSLRDFDFWGEAQKLASRLTTGELEMIEEQLEKLYPNGINQTLLNDLFAFYWDEAIKPILGISEERILEREPF